MAFGVRGILRSVGRAGLYRSAHWQRTRTVLLVYRIMSCVRVHTGGIELWQCIVHCEKTDRHSDTGTQL